MNFEKMGDLWSFVLPNTKFKAVLLEKNLKFIFRVDIITNWRLINTILNHSDLATVKTLPMSKLVFYEAIKRNNSAIVKYLLPKVDPSMNNNHAIWLASNYGYTEIVRLLLADPRVDSSAGNNAALGNAAFYGHTETVRLLLADSRVDPSGDGILKWAIQNGCTEIVLLLLKDKRVDPSVEDNYAIRNASCCGYTEIVRMLLADKRVNPSARNNCALECAIRNGHTEIVKLLTDKQCVLED
jgi:ankyrin repeat protein